VQFSIWNIMILCFYVQSENTKASDVCTIAKCVFSV